ncbi:MAG: hypothetical protein Q4C96_09645 [Planctomycetia bacterium]|nr:hypothetical protein [Planctomycetia bacterium]
MKSFLPLFLVFSLVMSESILRAQFKDSPPDETLSLPKHFDALFIGNSFTFFHGGVNHLTAAMVNTIPGRKMSTVSACPGGYALLQHAELEDAAKTVEKIKSKKWDIIVLQEQSIFPIMNRNLMIDGGCRIHQIILEHSPETQVILYETWARGFGMLEGFGQDEPKKEKMKKYYQETFGLDLSREPYSLWLKDGISGAYAQLKTEIDKQVDKYNADPANKTKAPYAKIVHAGSYWELCKAKEPEINLYHTDNYHQSPAGNYLTALIFYKTLTGKEKLTGIYKRLKSKRINPKISAADAAKLEKIAQEKLD